VAGADKLVDRAGDSVLPPAGLVIVVSGDQASALHFREVELEIPPDKLVEVIAIDVDPVEVAVLKLSGGSLRSGPVNLDAAPCDRRSKAPKNRVYRRSMSACP